MSEFVIYPTHKFIKAGFALSALAVLAIEIVYYLAWRRVELLHPLPVLVPLLFVWPVVRWLRLRYTKAVITEERLRYESGVTSRTTRNIHLSKVQDVRVEQSVGQRLMGVGDLSIETAGEASRLTLHNVDNPQTIADRIMDLAQKGTSTA
ncbi:MAG TPA: PH domain-containing protein [Bryobacteraceae bacterium]|nr:PH domain-containing protein [Bryobacteraceae bacterium]